MSQRKFNRSRQKAKKAGGDDRSGPARQPSIQAMVWYREEDWDALKNMFADGDRLPDTYADWLQRAEKMCDEAQAAGDAVVKVYIDPVSFPEWCEKKGLPMDAEARSRLAIESAQAQTFSL